MAEESQAKRIKLNLKLDRKPTFVPLFNAFCIYVNSIKEEFDKNLLDTMGISYNESEHPINIEDIKVRFAGACYFSVGEFAKDCRQITIKLKGVKKSQKGRKLHLATAREFNLYIDRTILPVAQAEGLLKLYQDSTATAMKLNINNELPEDQYSSFRNLSPETRWYTFLRWPLPRITAIIDSGIRARANLSSNDSTFKNVANTESLSMSAVEPNENASVRDFTIGGVEYEVGVTSSSLLPKYSIYISRSNKVSRTKFVARYVDKFLKSTDLNRIGLDLTPRYDAQLCAKWIPKETHVETILEESLYKVIRPAIQYYLDKCKQDVENDLNSIIDERHYIKRKDRTTNGTRVSLTSFIEKTTIGSEFFGLKFDSDMEAGYLATFESPSTDIPVFYTAIGETKYPTFKLGQCVKDLEGNRKGELTIDGRKRASHITELEKTLYKYTSYCTHIGVPRYVITDLEGFLFVKLQFKDQMKRKNYGTGRANGLQYIKAEYSYFSKQETYIRLFFLSFLKLDQKYLKEIEMFKKAIFEKASTAALAAGKEQEQKIEKEEGTVDTAAGASGGTGVKGGVRRGRSTDARGAKDNNLTSSKQSLIYDETMFQWVSYAELGDVITDLVATGLRGAQIVKVDSLKFTKLVFEKNMCVKGPLPEKSILKVYDPFLGQLFIMDKETEEYVPATYDYQDCIDYTVREVKAYCALSEFSGDFIPRMYSYGRLSDLYPYVESLYLKLCGGFIMIEDLKEDRGFKVTREFFKKKILPAFEKMHSRNVVHGDIKWDNGIITEDGDFKIIDFGHSKISTDKAEKKAEIELVYEHFGSPKWR